MWCTCMYIIYIYIYMWPHMYYNFMWYMRFIIHYTVNYKLSNKTF